MTEQYLNNPLHGLGLEALVTELVDFYGFEILAAAMNFNCFRLNPSIKGSVKFFKKTQWAREKLETFYLYQYKNLPRPDAKQYDVPPRDRIIPEHQKPREPKVFTLEDLAKINAEKAERAKNFRPEQKRGAPRRNQSSQKPKANQVSSNSGGDEDLPNPWQQARKNFDKKHKG